MANFLDEAGTAEFVKVFKGYVDSKFGVSTPSSSAKANALAEEEDEDGDREG